MCPYLFQGRWGQVLKYHFSGKWSFLGMPFNRDFRGVLALLH